MSLPQFKELALVRIEARINEIASYLVDQQQADIATLRVYQGRIQGLREAEEIMNETFREQYG